MEGNNEVTEVQAVGILRQWEEDHQNPNYDPIPLLTRLAEVIETETENYMKMDPDPFDERHPSRADPSCTLGHMLKMLFRKDNFMTKLVSDYLRDNYWTRLGITNRDVRKLNIAACRLMLDIMPGLETSAVFESPTSDALVNRLFSWAEKATEPLQTYATGLLAAAMEVQDIAASFREQNGRLVPLMLERLHTLQVKSAAYEERVASINAARPFADFAGSTTVSDNQEPVTNWRKGSRFRNSKGMINTLSPPPFDETASEPQTPPKINGFMRRNSDTDVSDSRRKTLEAAGDTPNSKLMSPPPSKPSPFQASDCSNSSWSEMETFMIGNVQMYPPSLATIQMFILRYLTPMGEYQEFLSHVFEKNALELILQFTNLREGKNARLAFEAMKYLAALLCHKKFSIEFINMQGLQCLLEVPRPSIAATGVSICLYYLAYCEDAMERVCLLPKNILSDLVRYALWLLECSHDSGRCNATMFFGLSFQFRIILEEFDMQDGLRKLYNVMSTLPILAVEDDVALNEDEESSARQIVRHVCVALKRYLEAHLYIRSEQLRRSHLRENGGETAKYHSTLPSYKACKSSPEEVQEQISTLLELMPFRAPWAPVDDLTDLGGITLLLQVIAFAYEWNYSGRAETVRSALEVLGICAIMPRVQMLLCERVDLPDEAMTVGLNVILGAAEGEIAADPDVQRAALGVLITCICAPIQRACGPIGRYYSGSLKRKTPNMRGSEEVIEKLWDCVRSNNGIMVLLTLMTVKTPITDADSIRELACRALAGLARSETVRQIISKLPLFTNGQLQNLMRDPILQDRRQEHVRFQKYALELLERVSGKSKFNDNGLEVSLANIHKANIIAQTKIQFNERQLLQLMQQHLVSHGMTESATALQREAGLPPIKPSTSASIPSPFYLHQRNITPGRARSSYMTDPHVSQRSGNNAITASDLSSPSNGPLAAGLSVRGGASTPSCNIPIKLSLSNTRKTELRFGNNTPSRSLEKQISSDLVTHQSTMPLLKECHVTLDSIITEYLTNQHALCKNPMVTCPQFNLFIPHKCPDPKAKNSAAGNFVTRLMRGTRSRRLDQRLVHSRFYPVRTFRLSDDDAFFTCCEFLNTDKNILVGTHQGEVKLFSLQTGAEETTFQCHESYISGLEASKDCRLLLSSSTWRRPLSALSSIDPVFETKFAMDAEEHVEFSKLNQDRVIGTKGEIATIYDIATGKVLMTLTPTLSNQYSKNRATFCPTDELVLSDGVLWDVSSGKEIHKFDKLNQTLSGVFHPNGLEVISNTEVWDLRTFHLLRTVPSLDMSDVLFSTTGEIIYTVAVEQEMDDETPHESSFKTLDAFDYSSIATIDVKKNIYDLACNRHDTQIAVVENQGMFDSVQESIVRLYDVGRRRDEEDEGEEEEEEEEEMDASDDGSNSPSTEDGEQDDNPLGDIIIEEANGEEEVIIGDNEDSNEENEEEEEDEEENDEVEILEDDDDDSPVVFSFSESSGSGSDVVSDY